MRNFQQIVKDVSNLKWSTVVLEEAFAEVEDNVKLAVRQANSYIFGLKDFPFRIKKRRIDHQGKRFSGAKRRYLANVDARRQPLFAKNRAGRRRSAGYV